MQFGDEQSREVFTDDEESNRGSIVQRNVEEAKYDDQQFNSNPYAVGHYHHHYIEEEEEIDLMKEQSLPGTHHNIPSTIPKPTDQDCPQSEEKRSPEKKVYLDVISV